MAVSILIFLGQNVLVCQLYNAYNVGALWLWLQEVKTI